MEPTPKSTPADVPTAPDVWWGEEGFDALIWADPIPYRRPEERIEEEQDE